MNDLSRAGGSDVVTGILAVLLVAVYAVLAHYASATPGVGVWALVLACAPMMVAGLGFARDSRWGLLAWLAGLALVVLLAREWSSLRNPVAWLYFLQHVGINGVLGLVFGGTLRRRRQPLCTALAGYVQPRMTPVVVRYTHQVTIAWTAFFAAMVVVSVSLFFLAPIEIWSIFANLLTLPLVAAMFLVENEVRKRVLPREDQVGIFAAVRAFRAAFRP